MGFGLLDEWRGEEQKCGADVDGLALATLRAYAVGCSLRLSRNHVCVYMYTRCVLSLLIDTRCTLIWYQIKCYITCDDICIH